MRKTKEKCHADEGAKCAIPNHKVCHDCKFYKTEKQYWDDIDRAGDRIKSLDKTTKVGIIAKYYLQRLEFPKKLRERIFKNYTPTT